MDILCDVDGVLADFLGAVTKRVNETLEGDREPVNERMVTEWNIAQCYGVTSASIYSYATCRGFCEGLKVLAGAMALVETLRMHGHVYFCTSPIWSSRHWMYERVQWLKEHFNADPEDIIFTSQKQLIRGDVLIDDKPETVEKWVKAQPGTDPCKVMGMLWNARYNASHKLSYPCERVNSWDDVAKLLEITRIQRKRAQGHR